MKPSWQHRGIACLLALTSGALAAAAQAPTGAPPPAQPAYAPMPVMQTPAPALAPQFPALAGGVPRGQASSQPIPLTLDDAIGRGLRNNLALLVSSSASEQARGARWQALSALLPQVSAAASEEETKINLAAFGFSFPGTPQIVGPFHVFDARGFLHQSVLDVAGIEGWRSARAQERAAQHSYREIRDLVVLAVANQYLLTVADGGRVAAAQAQLATATQARQQAEDMHRAGTVSALDVVRAQVQEDRERQNLIVQQNDLAKQRLALARAIGLPEGQRFAVVDQIPYAPPPALEPAAAVAAALATRPDYRAAQDTVKAAQLALAGTRSRRLPSLNFDANYGTIGQAITENHPTFTLAGSIEVPVFVGGRIHGEALADQARLREAEDRAADLRAAIANQVRTALLDMNAANSQVQVATHARGLAEQELNLARDRFRAGVAGNLEEVEAEQEVAVAQENYIASLYAYNAAKARLAQALGVAESAYRRYLQGVK
ncbi:MAG: TolC family protein [Terriglobales bacterium]